MIKVLNILVHSWCLIPTVSCLLLSGTFSSSRPPAKHNYSYRHLNNDYYNHYSSTVAEHFSHPMTALYSVSNEMKHSSRAQFLSKAIVLSYGTLMCSSLSPLPSFAISSSEDDANLVNNNSSQDNRTFTKIQPDKNDPRQSLFAYTLKLPGPYATTRKPLPTHLDEVNLVITAAVPSDVGDAAAAAAATAPNTSLLKGYSYGITVDPIRIKSLRDFGTPNEVAAKIVMAELRRDGVLDVTMGRDPSEDPLTGAYDVEYVSDGTRGEKHFVTRTIVKGQKLYVLTVQCRESDWKSVEKEVWDSVATFRVLDMD